MNCTYEEAKARYRAGDKFIVIKTDFTLFSLCPIKNRCVEPGDVLEMTHVSRNGHSWNLHYELGENAYDISLIPTDNIHCRSIEPFGDAKLDLRVCTEDIYQIMRYGCTCGAIERNIND